MRSRRRSYRGKVAIPAISNEESNEKLNEDKKDTTSSKEMKIVLIDKTTLNLTKDQIEKIADNLIEREEIDALNESLKNLNGKFKNLNEGPKHASDNKREWPPGQYLQFKLENGPEHKLHLDCLELIQTFKKCRESSDLSMPLILKPLDVNNRAPNSPPFNLNNEHILDFIEMYFYEWLPELAKIEHFKKARVQIGEPTAYLMEKDVKLFDEFKEKMWRVYGEQMKTNSDLGEKIEKKRMAIYIFGTLIFYFNDYLNCTMLAEKLAIYIACMLHDSTLDEIDFIMQTPTFAEFTRKEEREFYGEQLP